jgi:hypothetical protein
MLLAVPSKSRRAKSGTRIKKEEDVKVLVRRSSRLKKSKN